MEEELYLNDEEGIENEDDLGNQDPSIYSKAVIWGTDWTTETIVNQLKRTNIDLNPDFQRRDAWSPNKKSKFIESLILGLPVPPIILAERKDKKNSFLVIDGKQRLLSIMQFCSEEGNKLFNRLFLQELEILSQLNKKNYNLLEDIPGEIDYKTQFDNQTIRTIVIKNWPNEKFLYTVFLRLNTGSLKLSPQELRQALHPGDFLVYVNNYSETSLIVQEILKLKKVDSRMRDVEIILRYFAFKNFLNEYKGNLKEFLDDSCNKLNKDWGKNKDKYKKQTNDLEKAITFTTKIFGEKNRFSKYISGNYTNIFNRTIFDIMVFYFSDSDIRNKSDQYTSEIRSAFEDIMSNDDKFISSVSSSTKDLERTRNRYTIWKNKLDEIIK